jgi:hypothetical protein
MVGIWYLYAAVSRGAACIIQIRFENAFTVAAATRAVPAVAPTEELRRQDTHVNPQNQKQALMMSSTCLLPSKPWRHPQDSGLDLKRDGFYIIIRHVSNDNIHGFLAALHVNVIVSW